MDYDSDIEEIRTKALSDYQNLLDSQRRHLKDLESRLAARLKSTVTSDADLMLDWKKHEKSVSVQDPVAQVLLDDRGFAGEVDKFGHGLQRSFLLAILQELMAVDSDVSPTLILGCEEPELYQHPPQAKHLASVFMELSKGDSQVFITTHSPYFVDIDQYEGIKLVRKIDGEARIFTSSFSNIIEKYNKAFHKHLQNENQARTKLAIQIQPKFNEIFFSEKAVLVEGICDQACFESYLRLSGRYMDFQKSGASFIVCEGKSSVVLMLLIAKEFEIPFHVVIDCDSCSQADKHVEHIRDNDAIFRLCELDAVGKFPEDHVVLQNLTAWVNNIDDVFKEQLGDNRVKYEEEGLKTVGHLRSSKKNPLYIAASMKSAWEAGVRFPIFEKVVSNLLK